MKLWIAILIVLFVQGVNAQINIEHDKKLHFAAGVVAGGFGYDLVMKKTNNRKFALLGSIASAFAAGTMKELYDAKVLKGKIDEKDLLATTLGGLTVGVTINLFNKKKSRYRQLDLVIGGYKYD